MRSLINLVSVHMTRQERTDEREEAEIIEGCSHALIPEGINNG